MSTTPAGWYPQPDGTQRYWDGEKWTEHTAPGQGGAAGANGPASTTDGTQDRANRPWFKKKRFLIPGGIVALIILGSALSAAGGEGGDTEVASVSTPSMSSAPEESTEEEASEPEPTTPEEEGEETSEEESLPKMGTKVRDGKFEFTVTSLKCGINEVGDEYLNTQAQGEFCQVSLTISNIGDEPQTMFADNQDAYDAKGRKFSPDSEASIYDDSSQVLWEEINPGNTVEGKVFYDVPEGTKLVKVELHDSAFSGGVEVELKK
jgi:hypothetical protein